MPSPFTASIIGIRCYWICAYCRMKAESDQLVTAGGNVTLDPPAGWTVYNRQAVCSRHVICTSIQQRAA